MGVVVARVVCCPEQQTLLRSRTRSSLAKVAQRRERPTQAATPAAILFWDRYRQLAAAAEHRLAQSIKMVAPAAEHRLGIHSVPE